MTPLSKWNLLRFFVTSVLLFGAWLLFTESADAYSLAAGAVASLALGALSYRFFIEEHEAGRRHILPNPVLLLAYLPYILFRIYAASFVLLWDMLLGRMNPRVVHFRTRLRSDLARAALCASITLTPGTIAILIDDDHLLVHWFSAQSTHSRRVRQTVAGSMEKFLGRIWS